MAKFSTVEVNKNWYLEMFEKYTGQRIARTRTYGYRNQVLDLILEDPEANEKFSTRYGKSSFFQLQLDLDTGTLCYCKLPEADKWSVGGMYESENPGVKVMEVRPLLGGGWILTCRKED